MSKKEKHLLTTGNVDVCGLLQEYVQKVKCDTQEKTPPFKCAVSTCINRFIKFDKYAPIKFHSFPQDVLSQQIWAEKCRLKLEGVNKKTLFVCSEHFSFDDYERNYKEEFTNPAFQRKLSPNAVPSKLLPDPLTTELNVVVDAETPELQDTLEAIEKNAKLRQEIHDTEKRIEISIKDEFKLNELVIERSKALKKEQDILNQLIKKNTYLKKNYKHKMFSTAQIKLLRGNKKVFWSDDDLARAFTLRHIGSRKCYLFLKDKLNYPLPSLSCVQKWASALD